MTGVHVIHVDTLVSDTLYFIGTGTVHITVVVVIVDEIGIVNDGIIVARTSPIAMEVVPVKVSRGYKHPPVVRTIVAAERNRETDTGTHRRPAIIAAT